MKVSIITVCYQAVETIEETLRSVKNQCYSNKEHIVIDGGSTDGTVNVLNQYKSHFSVYLSEKDRGIYDAMNKGIARATGDIIGFLNADDLFAHSHVLEHIVRAFRTNEAQAIYADLVYFKQVHKQEKIVRYFKSMSFQKGLFAKGWCPPHPTFYVKRSVYQELGGFRLDLAMGNDVELMMRFLEKAHIDAYYLPEVLVKMRVGGVSNQSLRNIWLQNKAILAAAKRLNFPIPVLPFIFYKLVDRLGQRFMKPSDLR